MVPCFLLYFKIFNLFSRRKKYTKAKSKKSFNFRKCFFTMSDSNHQRHSFKIKKKKIMKIIKHTFLFR